MSYITYCEAIRPGKAAECYISQAGDPVAEPEPEQQLSERAASHAHSSQLTAAHPGVESILLWRIVSIGCCPKVSPKSVAARRTSLQTVELSPRCDATGCSEDLSITYFRISKRWDRFLANLLGETLVQ